MKSLNLSDEEFSILKSIIIADIENISTDISFFEELKENPKQYIDERISLAKIFGLNFWQVIELYCSNSDYILKRLHTIYEGKSLREFNERYERPSESEIAKKFLKNITDSKPENL